MIRGLYTAASGMLATTLGMDTMANNLANVSTTGFKRNHANYQAFPEMLIQRMSAQGTQKVGSINSGSQVYGTNVNFNQGTLQETGNTFDLGLEGDGFFTVKKDLAQDAPEFYTRAGNFMVNDQGYLTTPDGHYVMGELGPMIVALDKGPFKINPGGELIGQQGIIDRFKISRFTDNRSLMKVGDTMFEASEATEKLELPPGQDGSHKIHQGRLEMSNTNVVGEMINNIQGMRLYEALQKNIHMHNQALEKAVNEVGRIR